MELECDSPYIKKPKLSAGSHSSAASRHDSPEAPGAASQTSPPAAIEGSCLTTTMQPNTPRDAPPVQVPGIRLSLSLKRASMCTDGILIE